MSKKLTNKNLQKHMNIIDKVKAIFLSEIETKLAAFATKDGKEIEVEALEVGKAVTIDGEAAKEGEIELEDGTKLKIDAEGKIAEVIPATADNAPADEAPASMAEIAPDAAPTVDTAALETRIADLEETVMMLAEKINTIEGAKTETDAQMSALKTENEKLSAENKALSVKPAATPAQFNKIEVKETEVVGKGFTALLKKAHKN